MGIPMFKIRRSRGSESIVSNNIDTNTSQIEFEGYNPCAYLIDRLSETHNISESWKIKRYLSWIYTQATKRP